MKKGSHLAEAAAEAGKVSPVPAEARTDRRQSTTASGHGDHVPSNDDRKSAIVAVPDRKTVQRQREQLLLLFPIAKPSPLDGRAVAAQPRLKRLAEAALFIYSAPFVLPAEVKL